MEQLFREYPDVISVEQLQEMLNIGRVLAYKIVKSGAIKSRKIGRDYKITKTAVINYIQSDNKEVRL